jgi:hypothetical protein
METYAPRSAANYSPEENLASGRFISHGAVSRPLPITCKVGNSAPDEPVSTT